MTHRCLSLNIFRSLLMGTIGALSASLTCLPVAAQERAQVQPGRNLQPERAAQPDVSGRRDRTSGRDDAPPANQPQSNQNRQNQFNQNQSGQTAREQATNRSDFARQATSQSLRHRFGLRFNQQAQGQSQNGLTISEVQEGSPAFEAGLRGGDQITAIDGRSLRSPHQFFAYLGGQSGRQIPLTIIRNGRQESLQLAADQGGGDVAWLGVFLQDSETDENGAQVTQVYPAGPAARAGLRSGDVITAVDSQSVGNSAELIGAIEEGQPGTRAELAVTRNNQQLKLPVMLGSRKSFAWSGQGEDSWTGQQWSGPGGGYSTAARSGYDDPEDHFSNLPPFAMQLEHERRMYEQHQRIETEIAKLQNEVRQLREALQQRR